MTPAPVATSRPVARPNAIVAIVSEHDREPVVVLPATAPGRWWLEPSELLDGRSPAERHRGVLLVALAADLNAWIIAWNDDPKPFVWHKTADQILDNLNKYLTNL